jgi:UDP-N-acetyl-D-mannosaminuronic acid dehydrogenase
MPGRLLTNINTYERVVGGIDPESTERALRLYSSILTVKLHPTDATTAEIVKTAENTYRDVQIAFSNEVALLCEEYGADAFRVRELVNTCPFRTMHLPGGGVGGHCLPKDPWLLISDSSQKKGIIATARKVNDSMPAHVADLVERALKGASARRKGAVVSILGASYLENSGDMRNSPSLALRDELVRRGFKVRLHDPYAELEGVVRDAYDCVSGSDCAVLMVAHEDYRRLDPIKVSGLMRTRALVDARNFLGPEWTSRFYYVGLGKGAKKGK